MSGLQRFRDAQNASYSGFQAALEEIRTGGKSGHWIWYVFPQMSGLGSSGLSHTFAIDDEQEAIDYLRDSELRSRLLTITSAVADQLRHGKSLRALMGSDIDARKIVSSLTLFHHVASKLSERESADVYGSLAAVAGEVLAVAASQGYPRCAFTITRLVASP